MKRNYRNKLIKVIKSDIFQMTEYKEMLIPHLRSNIAEVTDQDFDDLVQSFILNVGTDDSLQLLNIFIFQ